MGLVGSNYPMKAVCLEPLPFTYSKHHVILSKMENQEEIWMDVINYEGKYQVSNLGNVKSLKRVDLNNKLIRSRFLKPGTNRGGYFQVVLCNDNNRSTRTIHQLVAESFLNHKPNGYKLVVNHIDFNKKNNRLDNLELVSQRENANRKHIKSTSRYVGVYWSKKSKKWGAAIRVNKKNIYLGYFEDEKEAAQYYNNALESAKNNTKIKIKKPNFTSKFIGVSWDKASNKWTSQIEINGKGIRLGSFDNEYEASIYYQNALIAKDNNKEIKVNKAKFSSKYKGVQWHKRDKKWTANVRKDKKLKHLGTFLNEIDAYSAVLEYKKTLKPQHREDNNFRQ